MTRTIKVQKQNTRPRDRFVDITVDEETYCELTVGLIKLGFGIATVGEIVCSAYLYMDGRYELELVDGNIVFFNRSKSCGEVKLLTVKVGE